MVWISQGDSICNLQTNYTHVSGAKMSPLTITQDDNIQDDNITFHTHEPIPSPLRMDSHKIYIHVLLFFAQSIGTIKCAYFFPRKLAACHAVLPRVYSRLHGPQQRHLLLSFSMYRPCWWPMGHPPDWSSRQICGIVLPGYDMQFDSWLAIGMISTCSSVRSNFLASQMLASYHRRLLPGIYEAPSIENNSLLPIYALCYQSIDCLHFHKKERLARISSCTQFP